MHWPPDRCVNCMGQDDLFHRVIVPFHYGFPVDKIIRELKYRQRRTWSRVLGTLLAREVLRHQRSAGLRQPGCSFPSAVVPVPAHRARLIERGFSASAGIARWCAWELRLPCWPHVVDRTDYVPPMAGLGAAERQNRILGTFATKLDLAGQHLALVDDVMTTGATTRELARELYDSGVASVELWVVARATST